MPSCFIKSCKMSYKNKPHDITFHRFPVPMKQAWLSAMGKDPALDISHTSVICSSHFKPKDFEEYGVQRRLKKDSVPSLKLEPVPRNIHLVASDVRIYAALDTVEPTTTVLPTITPPISAPIHSSAESTLNKCAIPSNANEFSTVCRTCLKPSGKMRSLYEVCPSSTTNICFAEMLLSFTPLKCFGNDGLPAQICLNCIGELNRCNAFKLKCLKSDGILRNWIDEVGKTEECIPFQEVVIKTEENITEDDQLICLDTIEPNCSNIKSLNSPLTMSEIKDIIEQKIDLIDHDVDMQIKVEDDLPLEINNASETTDKPYNCTYCVKSFTRSAHLIVHMRKHTGEKPFLCHVCDSSFSHKSSLTAHLRVHTGEKPYSCVVCDSSFYERSTLNVHMRKHTEERPYSCLICSDSFNHKSTLTCHMRKHTGERPYACTNCDLSFTQKQHLTTHLRTHTGEKPYRCTVCNNTFTQNNIMSHSCNVRSTENTRRTTHDEEQIDQEVFNLGSSDRITRESLDKEQIVHDAFNLLELDEDGESDADVEVSDHNTDTEQSQSEDSDDNAGSNAENNKNCLLGRDKITRWELDLPNQKIRTNIITHLPGGKGSAKDVNSIVDIWKLFFPLTTIQEIVLYTNVYLEKLRVDSRYQRVTDVQATNVNEVYALIGLLFLIGLKHGSHLNLRELWCTDGTAPDIFRAVMSMRRFYLLLTALRFDDINTREDRKKLDNLAPIRKFTDDFIERCQQLYTPGEFLTIDEMLESFRGRCKFRQYIANKPAKYGIKIYALVDSKTFYTLKMDIYAGKQPEGPYRQSNSAFDVVKRLSSPVLNTGRNLTMDNYFTSVPLAQDLFKNHKTTMVGTVRKNKKELPHEFLDTKNRSVASSRFAFCNGSILVSYIPKKNKNVLVLSTMHQSNEIDAESGQKPEIITFYNSTKGGVDTVDELKGNYSTARETNRWPMVLFYSFLNISSINAQIIYNCNTAADPKSISNITRREFLKELAFNLIQPHLLDRIKEPRLTVELRQIISKITKLKSETVTEENTSANKEFCSFCPRRKNRRTKKKCSYCSLSICNEHSAFLCMHCETKLKKHDEDCQFN